MFRVALIDADTKTNLWDIVFPPAAEPEKAESSFSVTHSVARLCAKCGSWTPGNRPYGSTPSGAEDPVPLNSQDSVTPNQNHRSHERLRMETVGCVRNSVLGNEVVLVSNLARGGLNFFSANDFPEVACIEMAIPYTSKAPTMYSLVKIVGARKTKGSNLTEYRAVYLA